ncbi:uncharacterized protein MYCGRDRAFT_63781 [Zymoseptoria tritici IPO323]|nr:uncharacterized protein MYCGRDRAFT_63781 [Zymoseptoria tritici IPO323]EGP83381.1 hypothetical protein MYCGRDRAFT_63781 [Zymoseptoria tritici IPO323]
MYNNHNHRQNHSLLNGGAHQNFQPQMSLGKAFQSQSHGHQAHHLNNHNQDHGLGHSNNFGNHHHTISASTLSNTTPNFTPAHLQNGTPESSSTLSKPPNAHWAEQLREYERLKMADHKTHFYARTTPSVSRYPGASPSTNNARTDGEEHGERRRVLEGSEDMGSWNAMDLCGQGLKGMAPALFKHYPKLSKVYLNWNKLREIPPQIGQMRFLTVLDLSMNDLHYLPPEIGMLTNLKKLALYDNHLDDLPYELGSLYQLEMLGIEGNPMRPDYKERLVEHGTQELVRYLRENAPQPEPPLDRAWIPLIEDASETDNFTIFSWNILCDRAATAAMYGYTPSEALSWQRRRDLILDEMQGRDADIMCLQEMDIENYNEFFRPNLASMDYKGVFWPKSRAQTMAEKEAKVVDGCAIFYKNTKYIMLDKQVIIFSREAISRPDMKGEHDVYNRVMPRDHVAVVLFLENRQTGSRLIVVNTHLTWEPWYSDIKIVQVAILMESLTKLSETYAKWPACKDKDLFKFANEDSADGAEPVKMEPGPSMKYDEPTQIPLVVCGDYNSTHDSGVYELITQGSLSNSHSELGNNNYGDFTRHGMSHPFSLKSAYSGIGELPFTNWTPDFRKVIDWVFYATNTMQVTGVLGEVDPDYMRRVPGWPNHYFPSDHLPLMMQFGIKERKERKAAVETDFGPARRESRN